jgi:flagellar motor protein MotB
MKPVFFKKIIGSSVVILIAVMGGFITPCADGLPGEYLVSSRWRDLMWWHSPLTNPAFITRENFITIRAAYAPVLQNAFRLWETGITVPLGMKQAVGASVIGENDGQITNSSFDDASGRLVAGGTNSTNNNLFTMLTYATDFLPRLSLGANLNIAYQSDFGEPLYGIGCDVGCSYQVLEDRKLGDHSVGVALVNLIAPSMNTSITPRFGNDGEYSRDLRLSWLADFWQKRIESGIDIDLKDILASRKEFDARKIEWIGACRVGARVLPMLPLYLQMGFGRNVIDYWGLAGGVCVPLADDGRNFSAFYQYNMKTEGVLASAHTVYVMMNFGKHREKSPPPSASAPRNADRSNELDSLRQVEGITVEEGRESVKITAAEVAVHFVSGSSELPPEAVKALGEIARFLRKYPNHPVNIEGHTDSDPIVGQLKERYPDNKALSKARAEKVKEYFTKTEKLPEPMFTTVGWGESKPIASNETKEGKYKNRRVVIIVKTQ